VGDREDNKEERENEIKAKEPFDKKHVWGPQGGSGTERFHLGFK
jgi:hypothetical protein